ncbi:hypothetical protein AAHA92_15374 [Salvia divinorum]|uniref:Uncharacterized protein n=1 Tax=Salvia divinorum TaxID=28513 RepID=A0ABD1HEJ0_SALDI
MEMIEGYIAGSSQRFDKVKTAVVEISRRSAATPSVTPRHHLPLLLPPPSRKTPGIRGVWTGGSLPCPSVSPPPPVKTSPAPGQALDAAAPARSAVPVVPIKDKIADSGAYLQ